MLSQNNQLAEHLLKQKSSLIAQVSALHSQSKPDTLQKAHQLLEDWQQQYNLHYTTPDRDIVYALAFNNVLQGRITNAKQHIESLLEHFQNNLSILKLAIHIYTSVDAHAEPTKAMPLITHLQQLHPTQKKHCQLSLCICLRQSKKNKEALSLARQILDQYPDDQKAISNYANCLDSLGFVEQALNYYKTLYQHDRNNPIYIFMVAQTAMIAHQCDLAHEMFNQLLTYNITQSLRAASEVYHAKVFEIEGNYTKACAPIESFANADAMAVRHRNFPVPQWKGERTQNLLIYGELAIGDQLAALRLVAQASKQVDNIYLSIDPRLHALINKDIQNIAIIKNSWLQEELIFHDPGIKIDKVIATISLYAIYPTLPQQFDPFVVSLHREKEKIAKIRKKLHTKLNQKFMIGLSWFSTTKTPSLRSLRSIEIEALQPLFALEDCVFISLQHGLDRTQTKAIQAISQGRFIQLEELDIDKDLHIPALIMSALDLVITTGNSTLHIAGALGLECWALLPKFWPSYYRIKNNQMYWYRDIRVFMQRNNMQWDDVITEVVLQLKSHIAVKSNHSDTHQILDFDKLYPIAVQGDSKAIDAAVEPWITHHDHPFPEQVCDAWLLKAYSRHNMPHGELTDNMIANALSYNKKSSRAWHAYGYACYCKKLYREAIEALQNAIALSSKDFPLAWYHLGQALLNNHSIDEAIVAFKQNIKSSCPNIQAYLELSFILNQRQQLDEEEKYLKAAIKLFDNPKSKFNYALNLIAQGKYQEAWPYYQFRYAAYDHTQHQLPGKIWKGESCNEHYLVLYAEQGIGDLLVQLLSLQYIECKQNITLICDKRLHSLLKRSFPNLNMIDMTTIENDINAFRSFRHPRFLNQHTGALPQILKLPRLDDPNFRNPILKPNPERALQYKQYLQKKFKNKKLVGIAWTTKNPNTAYKSINLADMVPAVERPEIQLINLQFGLDLNISEKFKYLDQFNIFAVKDLNLWEDIDGVIALISILDLVITSSNSNVQFAGSVGTRTIVLTPTINTWSLSLAHGEQSAWFKNMRIIRQKQPDDWQPVLKDLSKAIDQFI